MSLGGVSSLHINLKNLRKGDNSYFLGSEGVYLTDEYAPATRLWRTEKHKVWISWQQHSIFQAQRCRLFEYKLVS